MFCACGNLRVVSLVPLIALAVLLQNNRLYVSLAGSCCCCCCFVLFCFGLVWVVVVLGGGGSYSVEHCTGCQTNFWRTAKA